MILPERRSIRLKGYDYALPGAYFVTICTAEMHERCGRGERCGRDESRPHERGCIFGEVVDREMRLNAAGEIVRDVWNGLPGRFRNVALDAFVVMPNHVHGIIILMENGAGAENGAGVMNHARTAAIHRARSDFLAGPDIGEIGAANRRAGAAGMPPLGEVVRVFKAVSTRGIRQALASEVPVWQRNYYERIIRTDAEMERVRMYITTNPANWATDTVGAPFMAPE